MTRLVRTELLKLRTVRMTYGLLAAAGVLTALISVLIASRAGHAGGLGGDIVPSLATQAGLTRVVTATRFGMLFATVFGVIVSSSEFRHATATPTYLATPHRNRVMVAKIIAAAVVGLAFGAVASGVATAAGLAFVSAKGFTVALSGATMLRYAAGAAAGAALLAAAGAAVGSLVRQQVIAVVGVFAWAFVIESILAGLFPAEARYLPYSAAIAMAGRSVGANAVLPMWEAAALLAGLATVIATIASRTTVQRDIA
jgi:ABC-type transport system involved in multi-copper enzyme maturation permease subunit